MGVFCSASAWMPASITVSAGISPANAGSIFAPGTVGFEQLARSKAAASRVRKNGEKNRKEKMGTAQWLCQKLVAFSTQVDCPHFLFPILFPSGHPAKLFI